jgi:hypothetical protein
MQTNATLSRHSLHVHNVSPEVWSGTRLHAYQHQSPLYFAIAYYHNKSQRSNAPTSCLIWPSAEHTSVLGSTLLTLEPMQHSEMPCIYQVMRCFIALGSQVWYHLPMILMMHQHQSSTPNHLMISKLVPSISSQHVNRYKWNTCNTEYNSRRWTSWVQQEPLYSARGEYENIMNRC